MSLFSLLVAPLVAWYRHPDLRNEEDGRGIFLAFATGLIAALIGSFAAPILPSGLFDAIRWFRFLVVVALPAGVPLAAFLVADRFSIARIRIDAETFTLVSLIPFGAARAFSGGGSFDWSDLVLIPALWCAMAVGLPALIRKAQDEIGIRSLAAGTGAFLLPLMAASAAWAFFSHRPLMGSLALVLALSPATVMLARVHLAAMARIAMEKEPTLLDE